MWHVCSAEFQDPVSAIARHPICSAVNLGVEFTLLIVLCDVALEMSPKQLTEWPCQEHRPTMHSSCCIHGKCCLNTLRPALPPQMRLVIVSHLRLDPFTIDWFLSLRSSLFLASYWLRMESYTLHHVGSARGTSLHSRQSMSR